MNLMLRGSLRPSNQYDRRAADAWAPALSKGYESPSERPLLRALPVKRERWNLGKVISPYRNDHTLSCRPKKRASARYFILQRLLEAPYPLRLPSSPPAMRRFSFLNDGR